MASSAALDAVEVVVDSGVTPSARANKSLYALRVLVCAVNRHVNHWVLVNVSEKQTGLDNQLLGLETCEETALDRPM